MVPSARLAATRGDVVTSIATELRRLEPQTGARAFTGSMYQGRGSTQAIGPRMPHPPSSTTNRPHAETLDRSIPYYRRESARSCFFARRRPGRLTYAARLASRFATDERPPCRGAVAYCELPSLRDHSLRRAPLRWRMEDVRV